MNCFTYFTKYMLQTVAWQIADIHHPALASILWFEAFIFVWWFIRSYVSVYIIDSRKLSWTGLALQHKMNYYYCRCSFWQQMFCLALERQWGHERKFAVKNYTILSMTELANVSCFILICLWVSLNVKGSITKHAQERDKINTRAPDFF